MLRLLCRLLGVLLLAGGFVALVVDGTRSIAGGGLYLTTLSAALQGFAPLLYRGLQSAVLAHLPDFVWDPLLAKLMLAPVSLVLGGVGALCVALSHKPQTGPGFPRD
jgi:hypothetical protein